MEKLNIGDINDFVNKNISIFHQSKLSSLQSINLKGVLNKKNPYLFKAKKDRKSTRLNSSHIPLSRMPSSA